MKDRDVTIIVLFVILFVILFVVGLLIGTQVRILDKIQKIECYHVFNGVIWSNRNCCVNMTKYNEEMIHPDYWECMEI